MYELVDVSSLISLEEWSEIIEKSGQDEFIWTRDHRKVEHKASTNTTWVGFVDQEEERKGTRKEKSIWILKSLTFSLSILVSLSPYI